MAMNLDGITRLVGYSRVSTGEQVSEGVSGKNVKRPQFDLMVHELCTDNVMPDCVVFYTTSRMGRRTSVTATANFAYNEENENGNET